MLPPVVCRCNRRRIIPTQNASHRISKEQKSLISHEMIRRFHRQLESGSSVRLFISYTIEDPESNGGIRKVEVDEIIDTEINDTNFIKILPNCKKDDGNVTLMGHSYRGFNTANRSTGATSKDEEKFISFDGFQEESRI
ncbi:hypothetical protein LXL04_028083 [Taraxacum kok-saghyz]